MSNSFLCFNCGMMKNSCVCGYTMKKSKSNYDSHDFYNSKLDAEAVRMLKNKFPSINEEIIENFPFETPRPGQLEIISRVNEAIQDGYEYIILEAGTGTGKSAIATTLARMYRSTYIFTMTKQLQAQYCNEFDFPMVKGRGNFFCLKDNLDSTCEIGVCKTTPSSQKFFCEYGISKKNGSYAFEDAHGSSIFFKGEEHCNYWEQKANAINSSITLMNYDYAILELNYVKHFSPRNLLVLDEAHNIENKLMNIMELSLYNRRLEKDIQKKINPDILKEKKINKEWITEIEAIKDSYSDIERKDLPKNKADRIKSTINRLKQLKENLENEPKNWIIDPLNDGVSFKPLRVHHYAKDYLLRHGEICLFLSATILSHKIFSKWLGLDPSEVYHIKVDSPFPPEQRPIELNIAGKMSSNRIKKTAPQTLPILEAILKKHKNDKGLIHTNSYKCRDYILRKIHNPRLVFHNSQNRERVLNHFETSEEALVLTSPSMSEGVDLPYDLCRFMVIYKIPFPYLGDKQVNMRMKRDRRWYAYKTVMTLMQAYGRGMRALDDSCYTYILDGDINKLFQSPLYRSLIPESFKEAIIKKK